MELPLNAVIHRSKSGGFWAEVPALPGCVTQAETREELDANLREAIAGWIEVSNDKPAEIDPDDDGPVEVQEV